jgi:excisionase family DNA binding protein
MPVKIRGEAYFRTSEAAQIAGISRSTLLRWIDDGIVKDESRRDRRGWRLFTQADIDRLQEEAGKVK